MDLQIAIQSHAKVEEFTRKHRAGLLALVFTDIVGSTKLKQGLGDREAVTLIERHRATIREILGHFSQGEEIETAGDSFFIVFTKPSDAAKFALLMQAAMRSIAVESGRAVFHRIGIHVGEVWIEEHEGGGKAKDLYGLQIDTCARVQSLAEGDQILLTRFAFDEARRVLRGEDLAGVGALSWLNHGPYKLKGVEEALEICEVGELQKARLTVPPDTEKARRFISADSEPVLGWRPAVDQPVPGTSWILEQKLGEGGFGEVWLGHDKVLKSRHVFKFCFRADRVRSLRREVTLFRLLKQYIGQHPNIVGVEQVYFDEPPFYIVMNYVEGQDLSAWFEKEGGPKNIPLSDRIGIVAQIADALQAAHDSGVIHRDVKPSNILVTRHSDVHAYLTDFGIGQIVSQEVLNRLTLSGFTQTIMDSGSRSGTQLYMAPELISGNPASIRSDIYALGVVLYQLVVGDFSRAVTTDWAKQITDPLLREDLEKCFAGDPQDRFAGAGQLADQLRSLEERRAAYEKQQAILKARERAAYRRGILRTAALALVIIALVSGLAIYSQFKRQEAIAQRKNAQEQSKRAAESAQQARKTAALADFDLAGLYLNRAKPAWSEGLAHLARGLRTEPENAMLRQSAILILTTNQWYFPSAKPLHHDKAVLAGSFSPDGTRIVTASKDHTAHIWDAGTGAPIGEPLHHDGGVNAASFSPDRTQILTASDDHTARIWDARTGESIGQPFRHGDKVLAASFSPDGTRIVTASGSTAQIWDAQSGDPLGQPLDHYGRIWTASFSPDGTQIVTASGDAQIWDARTGEAIGVIPADGGIVAASFSPDSAQIVTASLDRTARIWASKGLSAGHPIGKPLYHDDKVSSASFSSDGTRIITASEDCTARIWDAQSGEPIGQPLRHEGTVWAASFSPDGARIITASEDCTARIWQAQTEANIGRPLHHDGEVVVASFSSDGTRIVTASGSTAQIWNARSGNPLGQPLHHDDTIWTASFSPDGTQIVTASKDYTARIWDARTGEPIGQPLQHDDQVRAANFSPDGTRILTASTDQTARIWDARTGQPLGQPFRHSDAVEVASFSPDGARILTVSRDRSVCIWDAQLGKRLGKPLQHEDRVLAASFSPDGTRALVASANCARTWDVTTGNTTGQPLRHGNVVLAASFSPDGMRIVTASRDHTARIWDARTGNPVGQPLHHDDGVVAASFSPDGTRIATASDDHTARIWDARTGQPLSQPLHHGDQVLVASFSPDGNQVVTTSTDHTARFWDVGVDLEAPLPDWFPVLLEALGGKRLNEQGSLVDTEGGLLELRKQLLAPKPNNFWSRLGHWFVTLGPERTISPDSTVTVDQWEDNQRRRPVAR